MNWMELIEVCPVPNDSAMISDYRTISALKQIKEVHSLPSIWPERYYMIAGNGREVEQLRQEYNLLPMEVVYITDRQQLLGLSSDSHIVLTDNFQRSPMFLESPRGNFYEGLMFLLQRFSWKTGRFCRFVRAKDPDTVPYKKMQILEQMYEQLGQTGREEWGIQDPMQFNTFYRGILK